MLDFKRVNAKPAFEIWKYVNVSISINATEAHLELVKLCVPKCIFADMTFFFPLKVYENYELIVTIKSSPSIEVWLEKSLAYAFTTYMD